MSAKEKAETGVAMLKDAIQELLIHHPEGLRNVDVAEKLDLRSGQKGSQKDYLSWSLLGLMVEEGRIVKGGRLYRIAD